MKRKTIPCILLCLSVLLSLIPITAFAEDTVITTGNATVTAPVAGATPSFTAISAEPDKYSVEVLYWTDVDRNMNIRKGDLTDSNSYYYNYTFIGGKKYKVVVEFTAVGSNTLSYDNTFTINEQSTWWTLNGHNRGYTFTATGTGGGTTERVYSAEVGDIDFGTVGLNYSPAVKAVIITNTGNMRLGADGSSVKLAGQNADCFQLVISSVPGIFDAGSIINSSWGVQPIEGLEVGTYTATVEFMDSGNTMSAPAAAAVTFTVRDHIYNTEKWETDAAYHWNPCTDTGCAAQGNKQAHNSDRVENAKAATFDTDGYTGDAYCSVCGRQMSTGKAIAAGKYIRESKATMIPSVITGDICANDLRFTSAEPEKYSVSLFGNRVFDVTDGTAKYYPLNEKFIEGHKYEIDFRFTATAPYVYDETQEEKMSTFTLNGAETMMSSATFLSGSVCRRIEFTAGAAISGASVSGNTLTVNAPVVSDKECTGLGVIAVYGSDGRMLAFKTEAVTVKIGSNIITRTMDISGISNTELTVKYFVWDSLSTLKPLFPYSEYTLTR